MERSHETSRFAAVATFDGFGNPRGIFLAFPGLTTGLTVAAGDLDGNGTAEIVVGTAIGSIEFIGEFNADGSQRRVTPLATPIVGRPSGPSLPRVAVGDVNSEGVADILVAHGPRRLDPFEVGLLSGVFVGAV
jgi:hypothetical protein